MKLLEMLIIYPLEMLSKANDVPLCTAGRICNVLHKVFPGVRGGFLPI